ncbi:MAG: pilus assembly protein PilM [Planctomycetota bacterium]
MVRSVGIDAGDYSVKVVELDGSYKKLRLLSCWTERVVATSHDEEVRADAAAIAVAAGIKANKMSGDSVLGHPCREAVLRTIDVPFKGADAIRKVIKSEVESAIHSHAVDDMVVDFLEVGGVETGSRVLVAAVPKQGLRTVLTALEGAGVEPQRVDLDTMALYRVAAWCGAFAVPASVAIALAEGEVPAALPVVDPNAKASVTAVLDLGSRSTRVLLVENGRLLDMRTLRLGDSSIVDSLVRLHGIPLDAARDAVRACLIERSDFQIEVSDQPVAVAAKEGEDAPVPAAATLRQVIVPVAAVDAELQAYVARISREFIRFLAASGRANSIEALWITGGACRLEGVLPMLREVFGAEPRELDVLGQLKHSLTQEEADAVAPQIAVAVGLALANIGGPAGYDFRREDLAFTRGFDRIKFPMAIACMVALFTAVVFGVRLTRQLQNVEYRLGLTYEGASADPKKPKFYGQLGPVLALGTLVDERYFKFQDGSKLYGYKELLAEIQARPVHERVKLVRDKLRRALELKQKESGIYEEVSLESGLAVMERFFEVLGRAEPSLGRYLLCSLDLSMRSAPSRDVSGRYLQVRFAFRGDDFRERFAAVKQAVEEECKREDSPFHKIEESIGGDLPFRDGAEKGVTGSYYDLKIHVRDSFAPFGV